ncbi:hypothetical protein sscle_15g103860 [Sclerotinia sclerotiorum 1980 UF-70]|uniref:HNH nuclease domain-containing protein n=1 Tax=Sclerotinia sclerotiorum (strain ATCC 18683 / 1980 / Ss-1) TaxID=665079 RepID=A0A1D9QL06_SCLS1|nr:hypothetical protein sscle_15g103860 [Sclerotinia sclerotiorum 1980 UF-70]
MIEQELARSHKSTIPNHSGKETMLELAPHAQIELILQLYMKEERESTMQTTFKNELVDYYDVKHIDEKDQKQLWCMASHKWGAHTQRKAVHIMPFRLRQLPLIHILGKDVAEELWPVKNGHILEAEIEHYFDNCQPATVPSLSEEDA